MAKAIRDVYGEALVKYGAENKDIVVLDADVSSSTKSSMFGKAYPERFYNCGIAEYAMTGMAAGMAINGKIPFVNTFAVFISTIGLISARAFMSYQNLNIKYVGAYGGLSNAYDGASHQALEDIATMRALPGVTVMVASDEYITDWMVKTAINTVCPMYIRISREACPICHDSDEKYEIGKGIVVNQGNDLTVIACGIMVSQAIKVALKLKEKGFSIRVIDMFTIKPIDKKLIIDSARETGAVITLEEHNVIGGLGGAVSEVLSQAGIGIPFKIVGIEDCHGESGAYSELLKKHKLDVESILGICEEVLEKKHSK